jgi:hypothetical protein
MLLVPALVLFLSLGSSSTHAGDLGNPTKALASMSHARAEAAKKCYLDCLESRNEGVVQSAIGIVLQWRLISPTEDLSRLEKKINDLAVEGASPEIRFKASLASLVMDKPSLVDFDAAACSDCGQLFDAITAVARQMVISQTVR